MPKHILLIMTDQQRADYVGYREDGKAVTPSIDAIAHSAWFDCCQTANPICTPARTALITGRYPRQIGTLTMAGDLFPQIPTMMQALQGAGYRTYGIGKFHYLQTAPWGTPRGGGLDYLEMERAGRDCKQFGYDYIFEAAGKQLMMENRCHYAHYLEGKGLLERVRDFWREFGGPNGDTADHNYDQASAWPFDEEDYPDAVIGRKARERLAAHDPARPFFMKLSFCGPHKPYDAPRRYLDRFPLEREEDFVLDGARALTAAEKEALWRQRRSAKAMLALIDDQVAATVALLQERGMWEETLVLFTSDHGDMLGDHYMIQKGVPWRESLNVPLAVRLPGAGPIGSNGSPVELTDLTATMLDYAGLDPQQALSRDWPAYNNRIPGRSLLPVLRGEAPGVREFDFSESDFTEERGDGTVYAEVIAKRGPRRTNAWQAITTARTKYVKYLEYDTPGDIHEEFYDHSTDPGECHNLIGDPAWQEQIREARARLMFVLDSYPPCQKTWAEPFLQTRRG